MQALLLPSSTLGLPLIDMMTANDEIPMLRYRLQLHAPLAVKTIILESNLSHSGAPKPLHVHNALTAEEIERYHVEVINVPFSAELRGRMAGCTNSSSVRCTWLLEVAQRKYVMSMLQPTIDRTLQALGIDDVLIHMSDLDELLDVQAVNELVQSTSNNLTDSGCVSPKLRNFVYGEHCPATYPPWSRSVLFRAGSGWLKRHMSPALQLRKLAKGHNCAPSARWLGWHFGYFMSTERIVHKLNSFAHSNDPFIKRITRGDAPLQNMERRISRCLDVHGRRYGPAWAAYDGKLPSLTGWPRNPIAPLRFNMTDLARERAAVQVELARASKHAGGKGGGANAAGMVDVARGKLSSIDAEIDAVRRREGDMVTTASSGRA